MDARAPTWSQSQPITILPAVLAIMQAEIIENSRSLESESRFVCADLEPISVERQDDTAKVYALTYYAEYERGEGGRAKLASAESAPAVFIAEKDDAAPTGWRLSDFLQPGLGSNYAKDVSELFPKSLEKTALECDTSVLSAKCERLAEEYCGKTGLVYPLSDFGEAQSVKMSYYCPDPAHYAIESTRIDAAFTLDFNALKFLFADDYSPVNADGGSFRYRERTGEFALNFAGDDGIGVIDFGFEVDGCTDFDADELFFHIGVEIAFAAQERAHATHRLPAVNGHERVLHAHLVTRDVIKGMARSGRDTTGIVKPHLVLEQRVSDARGVGTPVSAALKDQGAVKHVVGQRLHSLLLRMRCPFVLAR